MISHMWDLRATSWENEPTQLSWEGCWGTWKREGVHGDGCGVGIRCTRNRY